MWYSSSYHLDGIFCLNDSFCVVMLNDIVMHFFINMWPKDEMILAVNLVMVLLPREIDVVMPHRAKASMDFGVFVISP